MHPVLIGSRALNYWKPDRKVNPSTDWDVISYDQHTGCEVHDPDFLNNRQMTWHATNHWVTLPDGSSARVMSMLGLAMIKRSHLWRDLSFQKHITDWHKHGLCAELQGIDYTKHPIVQIDLEERTALTKKAFPQGNPNLMQSVEDFFDDAVQKKYNHDYLHELFAYYDKPLYTRLQENSKLAWCSKELWYNLSAVDQVKCIAEEVQVIATERFLVPRDWDFPAKLAYMKALDKVCTTLCSGYFRDAAIDNYPAILELFDKSRFDRVQAILNSSSAESIKSIKST